MPIAQHLELQILIGGMQVQSRGESGKTDFWAWCGICRIGRKALFIYIVPRGGNSTNPEELLAAAHASCFTLSLGLVLQAAGYTPTELSTEAVVTPGRIQPASASAARR